jgi:hypothetical protein
MIAPSFAAPTFFFYDNHDTPLRRIRYPQHQPTTFDFHPCRRSTKPIGRGRTPPHDRARTEE